MAKIILASGSPRRRQLLGEHFDLKVLVPRTDERSKKRERPTTYVRRVALNKWKSCLKQFPNQFIKRPMIVVAADTIVVLKGRILGKPSTREEAKRMLRALSNKKHLVMTAVSIGWSDKAPRQFMVSSMVEFRKLTAEDVVHYLQSGEWKDKAGAYGIQGKALGLVHRINGSLTNIVGLPVSEVVRAVAQSLAQRPKFS